MTDKKYNISHSDINEFKRSHRQLFKNDIESVLLEIEQLSDINNVDLSNKLERMIRKVNVFPLIKRLKMTILSLFIKALVLIFVFWRFVLQFVFKRSLIRIPIAIFITIVSYIILFVIFYLFYLSYHTIDHVYNNGGVNLTDQLLSKIVNDLYMFNATRNVLGSVRLS
ncbi:P9-2 [Diaphorina citri reovirus]|nr:P9-2 [Diaphorina citri reovirus]